MMHIAIAYLCYICEALNKSRILPQTIYIGIINV